MAEGDIGSSDFEITYTFHCPPLKPPRPVLDRSKQRILEMYSDGAEDHVANILETFRQERDVPDEFRTLEHVQRVVWSLVQEGLVEILYRQDDESPMEALDFEESWRAFVPRLWIWPPQGDDAAFFVATEKGMNIWGQVERAADWYEVIDWSNQPLPPKPDTDS